VMVHLPAPTFGTTHWRVDVYGAGSTFTSEYTTTSRPVLLFILLAALILCIVLVIMRMMLARHARKAAEAERANGESDSAAEADASPAHDRVESSVS